MDPFVFEKAVDLFKGDYGTQNVYPIFVDPSSLTGMQRLEILQNYLRIRPGVKDFVDNLAIGGANIFDFRKTIHLTRLYGYLAT